MELRINGVSQPFAIPTEVNRAEELDRVFDVCVTEDEAVFPLLLFEANKLLFDLGMATWFRLLAADVKE